MMKKITVYIKKHKIIFSVLFIILATGGYYGYTAMKGNAVVPRYVLAQVEKGTIITTISGSGQISASNQQDIGPKVSGDIIFLNIRSGQEIKSGATIAQLNAQDQYKAIRDAEANLESAKLSLEKLQQGADSLTVLQAENSLTQTIQSKQTAIDNLAKSYEDAFTTLSNSFLDLPDIKTGIQDILLGHSFTNNQQNIDFYADAVKTYDSAVLQYKENVSAQNQNARTQYDNNYIGYKAANRYSDIATIESLVNETYETTKSIAEAVKSLSNLIQFYKDKMTERGYRYNTIADTHLTSINSYTGTINSLLSNILSIKNTIKTNKETIIDTEQSIEEKTQSLAKIKAGTDPLDIQSQQLSIRSREDALNDARQKLSDYTVRAPFDGIVAAVNIKKGDSISSGTTIATVITHMLIAEISLNEVDAAKVSVGQKATLTFDAVEGLEITGEVTEIDSLGTLSSGVVSYNARISFDTQDDRIKPGMSVSASIITEVKTDTLIVPSAAIKSDGQGSYVEIFDQVPAGNTANGSQGFVSSIPPQQQAVIIGTSNDTSIEITSGLNEGDQVVVRTITGTSATNSSTGTSIFNSIGGSRNTRQPQQGGAFIQR